MRRFISRLNFETKLNLGICAIILGFAVVLLPLVASMSGRALNEEGRKRGISMAESLAARVVDPLLARDYLRMNNLVRESRDQVYTFIQDRSGHVLSHSFSEGFPVDLKPANQPTEELQVRVQLLDTGEEYLYDFAAPVVVAGESIGTVRLALAKSRISETIFRLVNTIALFFGIALLLAIIMGSYFSRRVTMRLAHLRKHAEELIKGNLSELDLPQPAPDCWSVFRCQDTSCPAFGQTTTRCWQVEKTHCSQHAETRHRTSKGCLQCELYRSQAGDEIQDLSETFNYMAASLRQHLQDLQAAERRLIRQRHLLTTVLDVNPDQVSMVDTQMIYQAANKAFAESVGRPVTTIQGLTAFDLFSHREAERRQAEGKQVLTHGSRVDRQERVETANGQRWYQVVQIPVTDEAAKVTGLLRMDRDITEIKDYEQQLIQAQKMESIGKLAGGVAHEINTPLGIILGYAQLLQEDVDDNAKDDLRIIEKQAKVCRKIVSDLLGFSRQNTSDKREMCFNNSVLECVSLVSHAFSLDEVEIQTRLDDRFPTIYGDPETLKQVWMNLLTNAKDAMGEEGGLIIVTTRLDTPKGVVRLQIADTGAGIPQDFLVKVFDPFFTTKAVGKGTGLGLSVSFGIIKEHQGEIGVDSPLPPDFFLPGKDNAKSWGPGTLFTVDIPLDHGGPPPETEE